MGFQHTASNALALLATGLLAGTFFYGTFNVAPTFREVPMEVHLPFRVALMSHNGLVVQSLMAAAALASIWTALVFRHQRLPCLFACFALLLALATFFITRFGNVPINFQIKTWSPTAMPENWETILKKWEFYNGCRAVTAIGSFIMIIVATLRYRKRLLFRIS